jgi:ABC-type lipoprotein export system ATPase subunit
MIAIRDLEFGYRGGFRLHVDSLEVADGESVALTGPSGCGKTTLLHLIAGILPADRGRIDVAGLDMAALAESDRRDLRILKVGLVFQEFELLEYLDVLDNVLLPYRLTSVVELSDEAKARAAALLRDVGLGDRMNRVPDRLSQGERQRVALCRALVTSPSVVLGDEPTGNLDPANRDHVIETTLRYGRESGASVLVVTHDHDLLGRFDRAIDIRDIAVTRDGDPAATGADR